MIRTLFYDSQKSIKLKKLKKYNKTQSVIIFNQVRIKFLTKPNFSSTISPRSQSCMIYFVEITITNILLIKMLRNSNFLYDREIINVDNVRTKHSIYAKKRDRTKMKKLEYRHSKKLEDSFAGVYRTILYAM